MMTSTSIQNDSWWPSDVKITVVAMDVKSFIRTFENVFDQLAELRIQVQEQCEDLENACYKAETQHRKNVNDLAGAFDVSSNVFMVLFHGCRSLRM